MKKWVSQGVSYLSDQGGSILPLTALIVPVMLGVAGVGVDVSRWAMEKRDLQTAADAAVLAAAWEVANELDDNAEKAGLQEATKNGYNPSANGTFNLTVGEEDDDGNRTITANISQSSGTYFSAMFGKQAVKNSVTAAAVVSGGNGSFCMLSLDPDADSAFVINGTATINSEGCGLAANSTSDTAFNINGGGEGEVIVDNVSTVGGIEDKNNHIDGDKRTGVTPIPDPYENLDIPNYDGCSKKEVQDGTIKESAESVVYCGGLTVPGGATVTLKSDKVHIIDGGDLNVGNGETLKGTGVSIIITNSGNGDWGKMDIKGTLDVSAPAEGGLLNYWDDFEGVAIYEDRDTPQAKNIKCHDMKGDVKIDGTLYLPSGCLDIGGNGEAVSNEGVCTRVIATKITAHGNPVIGSDCKDSAAKNIGLITVRLVL